MYANPSLEKVGIVSFAFDKLEEAYALTTEGGSSRGL